MSSRLSYLSILTEEPAGLLYSGSLLEPQHDEYIIGTNQQVVMPGTLPIPFLNSIFRTPYPYLLGNPASGAAANINCGGQKLIYGMLGCHQSIIYGKHREA
jgi:hypothetical protein